MGKWDGARADTGKYTLENSKADRRQPELGHLVYSSASKPP